MQDTDGRPARLPSCFSPAFPRSWRPCGLTRSCLLPLGSRRRHRTTSHVAVISHHDKLRPPSSHISCLPRAIRFGILAPHRTPPQTPQTTFDPVLPTTGAEKYIISAPRRPTSPPLTQRSVSESTSATAASETERNEENQSSNVGRVKIDTHGRASSKPGQGGHPSLPRQTSPEAEPGAPNQQHTHLT